MRCVGGAGPLVLSPCMGSIACCLRAATMFFAVGMRPDSSGLVVSVGLVLRGGHVAWPLGGFSRFRMVGRHLPPSRATLASRFRFARRLRARATNTVVDIPAHAAATCSSRDDLRAFAMARIVQDLPFGYIIQLYGSWRVVKIRYG